MNKHPKEPLLAVLLNGFILGLGYFYADAKKRGLIILGIYLGINLAALLWIIHPTADFKILQPIPIHPVYSVLAVLFLYLAFVVFVWIDGYRCVKKYNVRHQLQSRGSVGIKYLIIFGIIHVHCGINLPFLGAHWVRANIVQAFKIKCGAMAPLLVEPIRIVVDKRIYKNTPAHRGDIIIYVYRPEDPSQFEGRTVMDRVSRVVAVGGETIEIRDGTLLINKQIVEQKPMCDIHYQNLGGLAEVGQQITVPEGHYYVLGDNSERSHDSRFTGFVPHEDVVGKVYKIYYPFDRSGSIYTERQEG